MSLLNQITEVCIFLKNITQGVPTSWMNSWCNLLESRKLLEKFSNNIIPFQLSIIEVFCKWSIPSKWVSNIPTLFKKQFNLYNQNTFTQNKISIISFSFLIAIFMDKTKEQNSKRNFWNEFSFKVRFPNFSGLLGILFPNVIRRYFP